MHLSWNRGNEIFHLCQQRQHTGALCFSGSFCTEFLKCRCQHIAVAGLEENQIARQFQGTILGNGIIHTVLIEDLLEPGNLRFLNLNIGSALILPKKLANGLLSNNMRIMGDSLFRFYIPPVIHICPECVQK